MKNQIMNTFFLFFVLIRSVCANDVDSLLDRLNKINSLYANFNQQVINTEGDIIYNSKGELWVKRPNLFNYHTMMPDESVLISNGNIIWFYNPLIEQVTVNWFNSTAIDTPFILLISNNATDWNQYNVKQVIDNFSITPKFNNKDLLKKAIIKVTANGIIEDFFIIDKDGRHTIFKFKNQKNIPIKNAKFNFTIPKNVTLDDQR